MASIKFTKPAGKAQTSVVVTDKKKVVSENHKDETVELAPAAGAEPAVGAEHVGLLQAIEPFCEVGIEASYTHNLGDFRSSRVQVSLRVPCPKEAIDATFEQVNSWVEGRMEQLVSEMVGS